MFFSRKFRTRAALLLLTAFCAVSVQQADASLSSMESRMPAASGTLVKSVSAASIDYSGNVDLSGRIDVDDVHLDHDVYNARYTLVSMVMHKFLNGDVNGDRKVDIKDSVWIVNRILREK